MPIPLVWMVLGTIAATAGAAIDASNANKYAQKKKDECETKYYKASQQLRIEQERTDAKLIEIQNNLVNFYQNALQRSKPIFDFYGVSLNDLPSVAIPEGYETIENYRIPELKLTASFLAKFDILKGVQGVAIVGAAGILNSFLHTASSTLTNQGLMMISRSISGVQKDASDVRLAADKMEKEVEEFVREVNGMQQIFSSAIAAANEAQTHMQKHLQYFERYLEPCNTLLNTNKSFDELSSDEAKSLEYLYRVLNGMKEFSSNPFTVSV
jgi:hypothetical protein